MTEYIDVIMGYLFLCTTDDWNLWRILPYMVSLCVAVASFVMQVA